MKAIFLICALMAPFAAAARPRDAVPLEATPWPRHYRMHLEFSAASEGSVRLGPDVAVALPVGVEHDLALEYPVGGLPVLRVWTGGKLVRGPEEVPGLTTGGAKSFPEANLDFGADFTAEVKFTTAGEGTLFSKCPPAGAWAPDAKALLVRDGRLVYDIGWLGALSGGPRVPSVSSSK